MKKNMGSIDKVIRLIVALSLATLAYMNIVTGALATVFYGVAAVFTLTSIVGFCPLYVILGINSCKRK